MATSEETRREMERQDALRRDIVRLAQDATGDLGPYESGHYERMTRALHAAMIGLASAWRAEAIKLEDSTKRGAKGMRERLRASAEDLGGFAGRFTSPEFIRSLIQADEVSPPSSMPAPVLSSAVVAESATEIASIVSPVIAYLKGDIDTLPAAAATPEQLTIDDVQISPAPAVDSTMEVASPMTFPPLAFVAPSATAPDRLSWDAFAQLIAELDVPTQGSFSMISAMAECGMAYALDRLARRDKVPQTVPAWWEAGGTSFHRATEVIEKIILRDGELPPDFDPAALWSAHFNGVIHELEQSSGAEQSRWRVNRAGENFDWWRVHGPEMVRRYMAYHSPEYRQANRILVMPGGQPAIELELTLDLAGWPFKVIIDQVWDQYRINQHGIWESTIFIRDMKSGATKPASTFQLGGYAHALADALGFPQTSEHTIAGGFYDARAGSHDMEVSDLIAKHPLIELRYRAHAARQQAQARAYLPRVSNFAGGCGSCVHKMVCPAQG
ncbi:MAG: PD-(D/E)XK nuclease family protein [Sphingomonadales bacterium]